MSVLCMRFRYTWSAGKCSKQCQHEPTSAWKQLLPSR